MEMAASVTTLTAAAGVEECLGIEYQATLSKDSKRKGSNAKTVMRISIVKNLLFSDVSSSQLNFFRMLDEKIENVSFIFKKTLRS